MPTRVAPLLALVVATAVLYLAKDVLVPFALAILLSFLLAPAVRRLERWGIWRMPASLAVALAGFTLIGAVVWVAADQAISLGAKLPEYRHNITRKIQALRTREGELQKAAEALKDIEKQAAPGKPPLAVRETPATPLAGFVAWVAPFAKPVGTALAVMVFTILMLLNRENLLERFIVLLGPGRINLTTRALGEASYRVSRYLYMQLLVNAMFGIPFGVALYFIGVPNAMLWGLLGVVLRFIPYAGVWIAVAMPAALAFAISDDWTMMAWTVGVFLLLELTLVYAVEPWLYGRSAGLAPIAIIVAAIFWTWLWGPVGLLLATPLTVCVAVIGRYLPEFGFLNVLLGVEPVLSPQERFYQRLVALDQEEAAEIVEAHAKEHGAASALEEVVVAALLLAETDRAKGTLGERRERFIFENAQRIVEDLPVKAAPDSPRAPRVCLVAAHDVADHVAALAFARVLAPEFKPAVLEFPKLAAEVAEEIEKLGAGVVVCVSALPPGATTQAGYLVKRLRARFPQAKVVVGLWGATRSFERARERLQEAGAGEVATTFAEAQARLRDLTQQK